MRPVPFEWYWNDQLPYADGNRIKHTILLLLLVWLLAGCAPIQDTRWRYRDYQSICLRYIDPCEDWATNYHRGIL